MTKETIIDGVKYIMRKHDDNGSIMVLVPVEAKPTVEYTFNLTERQINFISNVLYIVSENDPRWYDWDDGEDCKFSDDAKIMANNIFTMFDEWAESIDNPDALLGNKDDFVVARWVNE